MLFLFFPFFGGKGGGEEEREKHLCESKMSAASCTPLLGVLKPFSTEHAA